MIAFDIDDEETEKTFDKVVQGLGDIEIENVIKNTYCGAKDMINKTTFTSTFGYSPLILSNNLTYHLCQ